MYLRGKQERKDDKTGKVGQAVLKTESHWCSRLTLSFQAPVRGRLFLRSHLWGLPNRMAESSFVEDATRPPLLCHTLFESLRICSRKNWTAEVRALSPRVLPSPGRSVSYTATSKAVERRTHVCERACV